MRGHGRSGKLETLPQYSSSLFADDFAAVTTAFKVKSPILVGWSIGGTIAVDVTAYLGPNALAGIIYTTAVPYLDAQGSVSTEWISSLLPSITSTNNSTASIAARIEFTTKLFNHPEKVPIEVLWSWLGSTFLQEPGKFGFLTGRTQNTTNLFEAGKRGLPVLLVNGGADRYIQGDMVYESVKDHFRDLAVHTIPQGSHAFFYEDQAEYVREVVKFGKRVCAHRR